MAVADYVLGDEPPPPELIRAFDYDTWGVDVLDLPPGEVRIASQAINTYKNLAAYKGAAGRNKTSEWTAQNPQAWDFVSGLIAERMKRRRND